MDLEQLEAFAFGEDRDAALADLVPGTEDYYYYHCLHYQHSGQLAKSYELLARWVERHGQSTRVRAISHRQALLSWQHDPSGCLEYLRQTFGLRFDHQRDLEAARRSLPSTLRDDLLTRERLKAQALAEHLDLSGFRDPALDWLVAEPLQPAQRRALLSRLSRPDYDQLVDLILADLDYQHSEGFGSLAIHSRLLLSQLDELAARRPALLREVAFIKAYLAALKPGKEVDIDIDVVESRAARRDYLERLWAFVEPLDPALNALKAHVLYHRLVLDRAQGERDLDRFLAYLRLPRQAPYVPDEYVRRHRHTLARMDARFPTGLDAIGDDTELVQDYLSRFLVAEDDTGKFEGLVRDQLLRRLFATAKILAGDPDGERWYALLDDPGYYQRLRERVDIELAHGNLSQFGVDEPVVLDVDIKNLRTLVVKIYEIDTLGFYLSEDREIDTAVDLDGLPASRELSYEYDRPAFERVRRQFTFDSLDQPGVYVIDFIGGGTSSRALIRKGQLSYVERLGAAGHVLTVIDEHSRPVPDARVWLGEREYGAREDGTVLIPYSTRPGSKALLLRHGNLTVRERFHHQAERYRFLAGAYIDREALIAGHDATLLLRPQLLLNGVAASLSLLRELRLVITTSDRHGVSASKEVTDLDLDLEAAQDCAVGFRVPPDLADVHWRLAAKVRCVSEQRDIDLAVERRLVVNQVDRTPATACFHLSRCQDGYRVSLLGKGGEAVPHAPVAVTLRHRDFQRPVAVELETDDTGAVMLGRLEDVQSVEVRSAASGVDTEPAATSWSLRADAATLPSCLHARAGEAIAVPYLAAGDAAARVSLLECGRSGGFRVDRSQHCRVEAGYVVIRELPAGDYSLWLARERAEVTIRVSGASVNAGASGSVGADGADGDDSASAGGDRAPTAVETALNGWLVGQNRLLRATKRLQLHVTRLEVNAGDVEVHLAGVSASTRVHVFASRFVPAFNAAAEFDGARGPEPESVALTPAISSYVSGRRLGDEYRYVIERQRAERFPGVMLERPSVLLNPWAVRKTETGEQRARGGDSFAATGAAKRARAAPPARPAPALASPSQDAANLDFFAEPAPCWLNLQPELDPASGHRATVRVPGAALGHAQLLRVIAVADDDLVYRELPLAVRAGAHRDLSLTAGLDPETHAVQRRRVTVLDRDQRGSLGEQAGLRFEVYDTVSKLFELYTNLSGDATLARFRFVLDWPSLSEDEKRARYSEYACHELHLFLAHRDPAFFDSVVRPYLANKHHQTFLDHYLLGHDLSRWCEPWAYGRLNALERALLGQRISDEREHTVRHLAEQCELLPPNPERDEEVFGIALARGALDTGPGFGGGSPPPMPPMPSPAPSFAAAPADKVGGPPQMRSAVQAPRRSRPPGMAPSAPPPEAATSEIAAFGMASISDSAMYGADDLSLDEDFDGSAVVVGGLDERDRDAAKRGEVRAMYRAADRTEEWAEQHYYRRRLSEQDAGLIPVSRFWRDFAAHQGEGAFLSPHVAHVGGSFSEMMAALAVIGVPFVAETYAVADEGRELMITAASPAIVFHEHIAAVSGDDRGEGDGPESSSDAPALVQVRQNYLRHDDRFHYQRGEQVANYVTGPMLTGTVYVCEVVLGNTTAAPLEVQVLLQIPVGAIPVADGLRTRGRRMRLEAYQTRAFEYGFYFAQPGRYSHFPVHVARDEELLAAAAPVWLEVAVAKPDDVASAERPAWPVLCRHGSEEELLARLREENVSRLSLSELAWRMGSKDFFERVITLLEVRHVYDRTLWSYGFVHLDRARVATFLRHEEPLLRLVGALAEPALLEIDPSERGFYEHLEYGPLIRARAHVLGGRRQILNQALADQYRRFLDNLACHAQISDHALLAAAYYLLLQDRVAEGIACFERVDGSKINEALQYEYMRAVVALYRGQVDVARAVAEQHAAHPVDRWRKRFAALQAILDEEAASAAPTIEGDASAGDWLAEQRHLAATQPSLEIAVEGGELVISYQHLDAVEVRYYIMDIELAFSRAPFMSQAANRFALVKPHRSEQLTLASGSDEHRVALADEYRHRNLLVEVVAAGLRKQATAYANDLIVRVAAPYGQVRVLASANRAPLPSTYVKVYARTHAGEVEFYKDGYTDIRGCFDYASLSTDALDRVERFALLVLTESHGALVREVAPPER